MSSSAHSISPSPFPTNSLPGIQQAVIAPTLWPIEMIDGHPKTRIKFYFMQVDNTYDDLKKAVRTTIQKSARKMAREEFKGSKKEKCFKFKTWEDYANVEFQEVGSIGDSNIRISFLEGQFSSKVGTVATDARFRTQATVKLGGLCNGKKKLWYPPTELNRRHILHEFGHVLGLRHEHQGPATLGVFTLDANVVESARPENHRNFLDKIPAKNLWNHTNYDSKSIMNYCIPKDWQTQNDKIQIDYILELSKTDKAAIRLLYPPDIEEEENEKRFRRALKHIHVSSRIAGQVIDRFIQTNGTKAEKLTVMRDQFNTYKNQGVRLFKSNEGIFSGIDPASSRQYAISDSIGEMTNNRLFRSIMKNIMYHTMVQNGIPTTGSILGVAQVEATKILAALSTHVEVGQLVREHKIAFIGESDNERKTASDTRDHTPEEHTLPNPEQPAQIDVQAWMRKCKGSATAQVMKPAGEKEVTIKFPSLRRNQVVLMSDESSADFINLDIDAGAQFYFNSTEEIGIATKARWALNWLVLYRDQWDIENFVACLTPKHGKEQW